LAVPEGATHVSLRTVDFQEGVYHTRFSNRGNFGVTTATASYSFIPSEVSSGIGISIHFFLIEFFQEVNGVQYSLENNSYNVLSVLVLV
jgi:hypothetical protein